jgi:hypothetical protein
MRIAEVASVATAVKREGSGSIEQVVWTCRRVCWTAGTR